MVHFIVRYNIHGQYAQWLQVAKMQSRQDVAASTAACSVGIGNFGNKHKYYSSSEIAANGGCIPTVLDKKFLLIDSNDTHGN